MPSIFGMAARRPVLRKIQSAFESARAAGAEVNLEGFGSGEVREAVDEFEIFGGRQALFVAGAGILDDLALALADFGQVDGDGAGGTP